LNKDSLRSFLLNNQLDRIPLGNIKVLYLLVELMADDEERVRKKSSELILKSEFFPTNKIIDYYLKNPHTFVRQIIIKNLKSFIPVLYKYLSDDSSFDQIYEITNSLKPEELYKPIEESYKVVPTLSTLTELALRTCDSDFSNIENSYVTFNFVSEQSKDIKKILQYRIKQSKTVFTELTLLTVTKFPELAELIIKSVRDIVLKDNSDVNIQYGSLALMLVDNPRNSDVLIERLSNRTDSNEAKLAIIEALGNLGNDNACEILVKQFEKGEPLAYYAARSLALLGDNVLPFLVSALEEDKNVPYIIETMKRIGESSYDSLMNALQKGKRNVRRNAAQCLTLVMSEKYGYEGAIRLLTIQLAGKNPVVIEAVTEALLTLGTPSIRVLIEQLNDDDLRLRKNAVEVLHYFGTSNIDLSLDGLFDVDPSLVVKLGIILYIYYPDEEFQDLGYSFAVQSGKLQSKEDEVFNIVANSLKEIEPEIRVKGCGIMPQFGAKAVPPLTNLFTDPNIKVRRTAVDSLRKIKSKRALITLINAAKRPDDVIAEISTRALGELRDPGVIDVIINNMKRPKKLVREAAVYAAVNIGPPIAKKLFVNLNSPNNNLVNATVEALGQMDSKVLEFAFADLRKKDEKWFKNLQRIITKMETSVKTVLKSGYTKEKNEKAQTRFIILLSLAKDTSIILDLIKVVNEGDSKTGITALNNLGIEGLKQLTKELKKASPKRKNTFIEKSRGITSELVINLLEISKKEEKLKELTPLILKNHTRAIRKHCQDNKLNYSDFIKNYQ